MNEKLTNVEAESEPTYVPEKAVSLQENQVLQYKYIDSDELSRNFGFCMENQSKEFTIYFVLYEIKYLFVEGVIDPPVIYPDCKKIERGSPIASRLDKPNVFYPYLKFVVEKKGDVYSFPSTKYVCMQHSSEEIQKDMENASEKSMEQIYFETACYKYVFELFSETAGLHDENLDIYQGFVEHDDATIFAFFDVSRLSKYLKPSYIHACADEMFYKLKIYNTPIDPVLIAFFDKNERFVDLVSNETDKPLSFEPDKPLSFEPDKPLSFEPDKPLSFPLQLYLCKLENGQYENVKKNQATQYQMFEHPYFGYAYYFTTFPLDDTNVDELVRFVCFTKRISYMKKDTITGLTEEEKEYYKRGIENKETTLTALLPTIENLQTASTIYFIENGVQFWSVKNILHFTEI